MTKPVALVTGACGGIGGELVRRLDEQGYRLILMDMHAADLDKLASEYADSELIVCDLSNRQQLKAVLQDLLNKLPTLDVAVINAGIVIPGNLQDLGEADIDQQLEVNLRSAIHLLQTCAIKMSAQKSGHIIATVSMGGIVALKGSAVYSATKAGLRATLTALSDEMAEYGVHVSGLYPSGVDTAMLRHEAVNGGSALNFMNRPRTVEEVGNGLVKALRSKRLEIYIPYSDSISGRLFALFPWSLRRVTPLFIKIGEKGREKFIRSRGL